MINPYPEFITDDASGVRGKNDLYIAFQQGYNCRSKELELVAQQFDKAASELDDILKEIRWRAKQ